ncbi:hypothetical protein HYT25_00220, partial [Candidatus Pacearchaeota archaeon]|nr:hypothetical protein [Candidatus Pacearchaeota archaeon]
MGKMPVLEESVKDEFLDVLLGLNTLNSEEQPLKTIRQKWMPELRKENPLYASYIMRFASSINRYGDDDSVRRAIDSLVLGYKVLKEQSTKNGNQMPVVDKETFEKV